MPGRGPDVRPLGEAFCPQSAGFDSTPSGWFWVTADTERTWRRPGPLGRSLRVGGHGGRARQEQRGLASGDSATLVNLIQIPQRHGGLLECESEPGNTRFTIYLPMESSHAEDS